MSLWRPPSHSPRRGFWARLSGFLVGSGLSSALVGAMVVPLAGQPGQLQMLRTFSTASPATVLHWTPGVESALVIPSLSVALDSPDDHAVPIASLTKLMTALVVLERLPLALGETGPCLTVTASDVALEQHDVLTDQSNAAIALGERLCESTLLAGLLIHSASDYATLLARLAYGSSALTLAHMNALAHVLGLRATHYVDLSGFDPGDVSSALDQGRLASMLMTYPVVRSIVDQPTVTLPVAGTLGTYQPLLGTNHVIGVKSGRTSAAGGTDVLAMEFPLSPSVTSVAYSVVLGAQGGDLITPAALDALHLVQAALSGVRQVRLPTGTPFARFGWPGSTTTFVTSAPLSFNYWPQWSTSRPGFGLALPAPGRPVKPGEVVGEVVEPFTHTHVPLVTSVAAAPPPWWQRLR